MTQPDDTTQPESLPTMFVSVFLYSVGLRVCQSRLTRLNLGAPTSTPSKEPQGLKFLIFVCFFVIPHAFERLIRPIVDKQPH